MDTSRILSGGALPFQMGYANPDQVGGGLLTRLYSRAFIVAEPNDSRRVVFVSTDIGMMSQRLRLEVCGWKSARSEWWQVLVLRLQTLQNDNESSSTVTVCLGISLQHDLERCPVSSEEELLIPEAFLSRKIIKKYMWPWCLSKSEFLAPQRTKGDPWDMETPWMT